MIDLATEYLGIDNFEGEILFIPVPEELLSHDTVFIDIAITVVVDSVAPILYRPRATCPSVILTTWPIEGWHARIETRVCSGILVAQDWLES